ncbi:Imm1 family immunity protein [Glycomyces tritici]|uniref:RES domain-containing protein n=1 Tax=Glycomyces tritici TaxID=2665176 RepID=A0ABT7YWK2_9ACTN|nr:Imm1 family immunity protein [Glycomyces tritici]MDN3243021.1 hypothetical protein [Glycomyces tritici]
MGEYDRPVQADPEILADLLHRFDTDLDSRELAEYARTLGLEPPYDPPGYQGWAIIEKYPDDDFDHGVLYWWGPEEDHGEEPSPVTSSTGGDRIEHVPQEWASKQLGVRISYTAHTRRVLSICKSHNDALNVLNEFEQVADPGEALRVEKPDGSGPHLDVIIWHTMLESADRQCATLRYSGSAGSWTARTPGLRVNDSGLVRRLQHENVPVEALIPEERVKAAILEFFDEPEARPSSVAWQPAPT